jgi:hypothetical protein
MLLKNALLLSLTGLLASCGANDHESLVSDPRKGTSSGTVANKDEEMGLTSSAGRLERTKLKGALVGVGKAFKSFVSYRNGFNNLCSGFYAFDDVNTTDQTAMIYFFTASHCFEKRSGLGFRSHARVAINSPRSFDGSSLEANAFSRSISTANAQIFNYCKGTTCVASDTVRIPQMRVPLSQAKTTHHQICPNTSSSSVQAVGYVKDFGLVWANAQNSALPATYSKLLGMATNPLNFSLATGVVATPGDSGSPVYAVQRAADGVGVDNYNCVHGIITREFWETPSTTCTSGSCVARGRAVFEMLGGMAPSAQMGNWKTFLPTGYLTSP